MENRKQLMINILLTVLFGLWTLNGVLHHEIWADEAQVWLLVKNLSVPELLKHLVNEGHPSFFYLLVMPFAKLNFSILAMQLICWLGTVFGAFMVLQFSPFNKFAKFSIITGAGFLYFFPVVARSYSILPFLVTAAAYLYTKVSPALPAGDGGTKCRVRGEYNILYALVLAMIANTHVIMFAFVFVLFCVYLWDNVRIHCHSELVSESDKKACIKTLIGAVIIGLGLLAVIFQLSGTIGSNAAIGFSFDNFLYGVSVIGAEFFLNIVDYTVVKSHAIYGMTLYGAIFLFILFVTSFIALLLTNIRAFLAAFFGIGFQFMIYVVSYHSYVYPTRIACAYLILLFAFWITLANPNFASHSEQSEESSKAKLINKTTMNIILALMFFLTFLNGLRFSVLDLLHNYSSAKPTAQYIMKNLPKDSIIIANSDPFALGLYYYLPENTLWSVMKQKRIKYVEWDSSLEITFQQKNWTDVIRTNFKDEIGNKDIYVILSSFMNFSKFETFPPQDFEVIYKSPPSIADGEAFKIYKFVGK